MNCFTGLSRATAVGYLFLLLLACSVINISSSCSNGSCQVPFFFFFPFTFSFPFVYDLYSLNVKCLTILSASGFMFQGYRLWYRSLLWELPCFRQDSTFLYQRQSCHSHFSYWWITFQQIFMVGHTQFLQHSECSSFTRCYNQEDTVTNQLKNGVRGLMLDMYDFNGDIWLCHSFQGRCFNFTAFQPAINTLREVEAFLNRNPTEIVTIIIEDYVHTPKGLTKLFANAGLNKYWFPVSKMPKKGEDWPTLNEMVRVNHRLLVFTSVASKEVEEGIAYQWKYLLENEAGDPGVKPGKCPNRKESQPLNSKSASLFLMNYFSTFPDEDQACKEHSTPLADMILTCNKEAGNMMPNFLAVNFYLRSEGGGVFDDLDSINGQRLCGCNTIAACQPGAPLGSCKNISIHTPSPAIDNLGSFSGPVEFSGSTSTIYHPNHLIFALFLFPWISSSFLWNR